MKDDINKLALEYQTQGIPVEDYLANQDKERIDNYRPISSRLYGAIRGATLYAPDILAAGSDRLLGTNFGEWIRQTEKYNPAMSNWETAGGIGSALAAGLFTGGAAAAPVAAAQAAAKASLTTAAKEGFKATAKIIAQPAIQTMRAGAAAENYILSRVLQGTAKAATTIPQTAKASTLAKLLGARGGAAAANFGIQAGIQEAAATISDRLLDENPEYSAEKLLADAGRVGFSTAFGGVVGGVFGGLSGAYAGLKYAKTPDAPGIGGGELSGSLKKAIFGVDKSVRDVLKNNADNFFAAAKLGGEEPRNGFFAYGNKIIEATENQSNNKVTQLLNSRSEAIDAYRNSGFTGYNVSEITDDLDNIIFRKLKGAKAVTDKDIAEQALVNDLKDRLYSAVLQDVHPAYALRFVERAINKELGSNAVESSVVLQRLKDLIVRRQQISQEVADGISVSASSIRNKIQAVDDELFSLTNTKTLQGAQAKIDYLDSLMRMRQQISVEKTVPLEAIKLIPKNQLKISPKTLHTWSARFKDEYDEKVGQTFDVDSVGAELYNKLYSKTLDMLDAIPQGKKIKAINQQLRRGIEAKEKLKKYGLFKKYDVDDIKFQKLYREGEENFDVNVIPALKEYDDFFGTNLASEVPVVRAGLKMYPRDGVSSWSTGRAILAPAIGYGLSGAVGGGLDLILGSEDRSRAREFLTNPFMGTMLGVVLATPMLRTKVLREYYKKNGSLKKAHGSALDKYIPATKQITEGQFPFLAGQAIATSEMVDAVTSTDNKIQRSAAYMLRESDDIKVDPNPLAKIRLDGVQGRKSIAESEAFERIANDLEFYAKNPAVFSDMLAINLAEVSATNPQVGQAMSGLISRAVSNMYQRMPKTAIVDPLTMEKSQIAVSDTQRAAFARYVDAVSDPMSILKQARQGTLTKEHVDAIRENYPSIYQDLYAQLVKRAQKKNISYNDRLKLQSLIGQNAVGGPSVSRLQQNFIAQNEPTSLPNVELSQTKLTHSQRIEAR